MISRTCCEKRMKLLWIFCGVRKAWKHRLAKFDSARGGCEVHHGPPWSNPLHMEQTERSRACSPFLGPKGVFLVSFLLAHSFHTCSPHAHSFRALSKRAALERRKSTVSNAPVDCVMAVPGRRRDAPAA